MEAKIGSPASVWFFAVTVWRSVPFVAYVQMTVVPVVTFRRAGRKA